MSPVQRHASESAIRASKDAEVELFLAALADATQRTNATRLRVWAAVEKMLKAAERE